MESLQDIYEHEYEKRGKHIMISIISLLAWKNHRVSMMWFTSLCDHVYWWNKIKENADESFSACHISPIPTSFYELKEN